MKVPATTILLLLIFACNLHAGWQHDLAVADKLLESGYYEAAIDDYQKIVTAYPELSPAVDRAWFGMAKAYHVTGNEAAAKVALERCLSIGQDETAASGARELYRNLKQEASLARQEAQRRLQFFESRYYATSWLNIITKLFDYFDLRKARKAYAEAEEHAASFNPHFLIDPVDVPENRNKTFTLTEEEMRRLLDRAAASSGGDEGNAGTAADTTNETGEGNTVSQGGDDGTTSTSSSRGNEATPVVAADNPQADLKARRDAYLEAYRKLQDALRGQNQAAIQQANEEFQKAQRAYKDAQAAVAAMR